MRKWLSKVVAGVLACSSMLSITACNFGGGGNEGSLNFSELLESVGGQGGGAEKVIDPNKTQLLVQNYTAGFGDEWLYDLENRFEKAYANKSYEDGKMGVQVWHQGAMKQYTPQDVIAGAPDIYFMEGDSYYALTKTEGALEDLTNIMVNPNPDDNGKTILSKLTAQQKAFYGKTDTEEQLTAAIGKMYAEMVNPAIAAGLCGVVYTQLSDVEDEINGLYTYDRQVCKVDKEKMRLILAEAADILRDAVQAD